jgi:hypothetical protein
MGRHSTYSQKVADTICLRLADGESLRTICADESMPSRSTVLEWLADESKADFRAKYACAREAQADLLAEEIVQIADTPRIGVKTTTKASGVETTEGDMVEHRRLQILARQWYASKLAPKKYGDKVAVGGADDLPPIKTMTDDALAAQIAAKMAKLNGEPEQG